MNTQKHTPGPWTVGNIKQSNRPDAHFPIEAFYDSDGERFRATVAEIPTWSFDGVTDANREEHIANARLISAAPDLLDAVQAIVDAFGDQDSILIDQCKAALRKAKGDA